MKNKLLSVMGVLLVAILLITACSPAATPVEEVATTAPAADDNAAAPAANDDAEAPAGEVTEIRWFIGLGAGGNPEEIEKEEAFVEKFNAAHGDQYKLVLDVVPNETAYDVLKTQIASGDVPDIVGPVGVRGLASFEGAWLDLSPYIEATDYNISEFPPELIEFYQFGTGQQLFLPFAVYPSAMWYNRDLFDEAGLEYPPHKWGAPYADGDEWNWDKVRELSLLLTVDAEGNDATMEEFDPDNITQFGYDSQWQDIRADWTYFQAASFVGEDGKAQMPEAWREAAHWYYKGMWEEHFIPNGSYVNSDMLAQGNPFGSGRLAMTPINTWFTCCYQDATNWDVAAIPAYEGEITGKVHADTFGILRGAKNPEAAFGVLALFLDDYAPELLAVYGGLPARESLQEDAVAAMSAQYPNVDINVFVEALNYPDDPSHESGMPNFLKASDTYATFASLYENTPDLDIDAELDKMIEELQAVFDEVQ
ncbi:MAG: extracellular solute-binding protein [Anaerolineae bacterium]|nr:extracellular solute-binding protein [Anaerolineae bacterium]